jgi:hypothetical protein
MASLNDIIKFGNTSFYAKSIIDLVVYVNVETPVYRNTQTGAKPVFNIKKGGAAGKLYSWINPGNNTQNQWLMFYDSNNKPYYIKITSNNINTQQLIRQGAKTVDEIVKEKEAENKTVYEKIKDIVMPIAFLTAVVMLLKK